MGTCDLRVGNLVIFGAYASGLALKIDSNSLGLNADLSLFFCRCSKQLWGAGWDGKNQLTHIIVLICILYKSFSANRAAAPG